MSINNLTLAENKFFLNPETSGLELFELTLFELILNKDLDFRKSRSNDKTVNKNGFLKIKRDKEYYIKNIIYNPIYNSFQGLSQSQVSSLLKASNVLFKGEFEKYKNDYILKNLRENHNLLENNFTNRIFNKVKLTDKGKKYKAALIKELSESKNRINEIENLETIQLEQLLMSLDANSLLLGKSCLKKIESFYQLNKETQFLQKDKKQNHNIDILSNLSYNIDLLVDVSILTNAVDYFGEFIKELKFEGISNSLESGLNIDGSIFPDIDFGDFLSNIEL